VRKGRQGGSAASESKTFERVSRQAAMVRDSLKAAA
jgi:hypothetical protein